jgi:hypothetical protein
LIVAALLGAAASIAAAVRLTERLAVNPWEPAIAVEAMRLNAGLPLYETGHATHMYGPLFSVLLAGIFKVTGLNVLAARITMSIFAFALVLFLAVLLCRGKSRLWVMLAILLFLGINLRTNLALYSAQPDCIALLIGSVALIVWAKRDQLAAGWIVSTVLFVGATLFKQTAAAFALVPIIFALLWTRPLRVRELFISAVPTIAILITLAAMRGIAPEMFHAVVTVPASIKVYPSRLPGVLLYFFATFPLLLIALGTMVSQRRPLNAREHWILSALIVLVPTSIWAICKSGGSYNSLLPAYFAATALFVARLDVIINWFEASTGHRMTLGAAALSLAILFSFFAQLDRALAVLSIRHGDDKYDAAIVVAHQLEGRVISPQDPTIAYRAAGVFGSSLIFELDTHAVNGNWPDKLPQSLSNELDAAKYVIEVKSYVPTPMFKRGLADHGFSPVPVAVLNNSTYTLWSK